VNDVTYINKSVTLTGLNELTFVPGRVITISSIIFIHN
jgi:hypothetical protein